MEPHPQDGPRRMSVPPRDPDRGRAGLIEELGGTCTKGTVPNPREVL